MESSAKSLHYAAPQQEMPKKSVAARIGHLAQTSTMLRIGVKLAGAGAASPGEHLRRRGVTEEEYGSEIDSGTAAKHDALATRAPLAAQMRPDRGAGFQVLPKAATRRPRRFWKFLERLPVLSTESGDNPCATPFAATRPHR